MALEPPLFIERFQELTVFEKDTIKLCARVTGNPEPEIHWLRNNDTLKSTNRIKMTYDGEYIELIIKQANVETDSGDYKCVACNSVGKASHGAKVTVDADIKFTKKLHADYDVEEHETLTLECETSHKVSTKWYYNGKEISGMDHRSVIQEGRTHKLVIKNATYKDKGKYTCVVRKHKTETTVNVLAAKPEFVRTLQDLEIVEKNVGILEVEVSSETADVVWQKDGVPINEDDERFIFEKDGGIRKLLIRSTSIHDEGEYVCALEDNECRAEITVIELPPEIITEMQDVTINKGEKAMFEIELTKGDALVHWYKDDNELQFSEHIQLSIDGKRQKLKVYNTLPEDGGVYSCQVGNQRSSAKLTVVEPSLSFIRKLPEYTIIPIGETAEFEVELSRADVKVHWLKNGVKIDSSSKYKITKHNSIRKMIIYNVELEDQMEYTCVAENIKTSSTLKVGGKTFKYLHDVHGKITQFNLLEKPSPPQGPLEIYGMTSTSFSIKWQPSASDGGSAILEYIVEIKEASTKSFKKLGSTKSSVTDIAVNYLEKDHGYQFKITARNAIGVSEPFLPEDTIVAGSRLSKYLIFYYLIFCLHSIAYAYIALGMNYHFAKTDETLYCLLGIFPPAKISSRSKYMLLKLNIYRNYSSLLFFLKS